MRRLGSALALVSVLTWNQAGGAPAEEAKAGTATSSPAGQPAPPEEPSVALPPVPPVPPTPSFLPALEGPKDNPTTPEKVQLGHLLFFEKLLSKDRTQSCETCHHPELAWTEGRAVSPKVGGAMNKRNAPTMLNIGYHSSFYWDGRVPTLEGTCKAAWSGQLGADPASVATALNTNGTYRALFMRAFHSPATADNIPLALASFLRALKSGDAPFDRFEKGDKRAVSGQARRGFQVFRKANCALCHVPPLYTDFQFHNAGVGWDLGDQRDHGRMDATKDPKDDGKFKTPTLRDIARTGPYFHDGSAKTLDEAIDFMAGGGKKNPNLDEKLKPAKLSQKDKAALKAFIEALSGKMTFTGPAKETAR